MQAVWKLTKYIKPYMAFAILAPILMLIEVGMDLLQPTLFRHVIDTGIANNDTAYIVKTFGLMIAVAIVGLIGGAGCSYFASKAAVNFSTDLRQDLYETITYFSSRSKDKFTLGKLITNITSDVEMLQKALTMLLKIFVRGPMMFIGAIVMVWLTARELFGILLVIVPILVVAVYAFTVWSGKLFLKVQLVVDQVNTKMQENLAGIRVIKAYNRRQHQIDQFTGTNKELMRRNITADQVAGVLQPLTMFVINMGIVAAMWLGAIKIENSTIEIGVVLAFTNYLMMVMQGLTSSSMVLMQLARAVPCAGRIVEVMEEPADIVSNADAVVREVRGDVTFEHVSFAYNADTEPVLKDISFTVRAGETVGIIGMTGSGKSTLMKMLPRLIDPTSGQVKIDGVPLTSYEVSNLREQVGFAPQKATLFSKSIEDNIRYGLETATDAQIEQALREACAMEFVEKLPTGVAHELTQGATNLSGGQKQRLAMARAFVRRPSILVLDDVTSALDSISEKKIQQMIAERFHDSTKFIVSSKVSSIRHADQIFVMDDGRIVSRGTHEELLVTSPIYQEIVQTQQEKGGVLGE